MLDKLISLGKEKGFFDEKTLGNLECSCCPSVKTLVIDYDKTKDKLAKFMKIQTSKSTDALKILPNKKQIDFLEMKDFRWFDPFRYTIQEIQSDLNGKIRDSFAVLYFLLNHPDFQFSGSEKQQYAETEKNYYLVVNIEEQPPIMDRAITLQYLAIKTFTTNIPESPLENFKKARLFSCREIDTYYEKILKN